MRNTLLASRAKTGSADAKSSPKTSSSGIAISARANRRRSLGSRRARARHSAKRDVGQDEGDHSENRADADGDTRCSRDRARDSRHRWSDRWPSAGEQRERADERERVVGAKRVRVSPRRTWDPVRSPGIEPARVAGNGLVAPAREREQGGDDRDGPDRHVRAPRRRRGAARRRRCRAAVRRRARAPRGGVDRRSRRTVSEANGRRCVGAWVNWGGHACGGSGDGSVWSLIITQISIDCQVLHNVK